MNDHLRGLAVESAGLVRQRHAEGGGTLLQRGQVVELIVIDLTVAAQTSVTVGTDNRLDLKDRGIIDFKAQAPRLVPGQARLAAFLGLRIGNVLKGHRIGVPRRAQGQVERGARQHEVVQIVRGLTDGLAVAGLIPVQQLQRIGQHSLFPIAAVVPLCQHPALQLVIQLTGGADGLAVLLVQLVRQLFGILGDSVLILADLRQHGFDLCQALVILPLQLCAQGSQLLHSLCGQLLLHCIVGFPVYLLCLLHRRCVLGVDKALHRRQRLNHGLQLRSFNGMPDHMEGIHHFLTVFEVFNANGEICRFAIQCNVMSLIR